MEFRNRNPIIYILSGKAGTGKNMIANHIESIYIKYNKKTINLAYASYLKEYAKNILNWNGDEETKPREFLQQIGIELIKNQINSRMLINRLVEDLKVYSYFYDVVTISDARFPEEIDTIRNTFKNVIVIHVYGLENKNSLTIEQKKHSTEISLDNYKNYDYEINNSGLIEDLKSKIELIIRENINE